MNRYIISALIGLLMTQGAMTARSQQRTIEGYAAKVNDRVVMVSSVMGMVRSTEERLRSTLQGEELRAALAQAYQEALDTLIERQLILEEYENQEGEIPPQVVDDEMAQILADRFGSDRSELLKSLQREHLSYDEWREQVEERLIISVMRREAVFNRVSISPDAARKYYDENIDNYRTPAQVKLRMIKVSRGTTQEELTEKAQQIKDARSRIKFGETFAAVARDLSEGSKAANGGDWGWMPVRDLNSELVPIASQLKPGILSRIVAAGDSFYLLLVEERQDEVTTPFEEVRGTLEQELRLNEINRIQKEWTARLREKHFVKEY